MIREWEVSSKSSIDKTLGNILVRLIIWPIKVGGDHGANIEVATH